MSEMFYWTEIRDGAVVTAWPCPGPITSYFGAKDIAEHSQGHSGVDIGAPEGAPVYAPCDATVKDVFAIGVGRDDWEQTFGNSVILRHGACCDHPDDVHLPGGGCSECDLDKYEHDYDAGYVSLYAHLRDNPSVVEGTEIRRGTLLGYVGNTGLSFGPHLHWGLAPASNPYLDRSELLNPLAFCRGAETSPLPGGEFLPEPEQEPLRPPFSFWADPLAARWAQTHEGKH